MNCTSTKLSYGETGYFSSIVDAYLKGDKRLRGFYEHSVSVEGIDAAIRQRKQFRQDRTMLVEQLRAQYKELPVSAALGKNITLLSEASTYTICTAHQPAIFTGTLFFIYKILHTIRLAAYLKTIRPEENFVPVYYMGAEDADLDELGHIYLNGEKLIWETDQRGSIGRMHTRGLDKLLQRIEGELGVLPHGPELIALMKDCYLNSQNIASATLKLVNRLFGDYGLIVVIPDSPSFKRALVPVFEDELFHKHSAALVEETSDQIGVHFKAQAHSRDINLFYLKDDLRERIEQDGESFRVVNTDIRFSREAILDELHNHPERFSPNVILRGVLQESILPNIAFIGGGGELAYWMQLRAVFSHFKVPYPVLVLRNSFLLIEKKWKEKMDRLGLAVPDIFRPVEELLHTIVKRESTNQLTLSDEIEAIKSYYQKIRSVAGNVDETLIAHVEALQTQTLKRLNELQGKLLRAEKRKFAVQHQQLGAIKNALFPGNNLQERIENFLPYYAKWGQQLIDQLYQHSLALEQEFVVLETAD